MEHRPSPEDLDFRARFESGDVAPSEFDHRAHVRLAYAHLATGEADSAYASIRRGLHDFLARNGVDPAKYHDTLTRAWILICAAEVALVHEASSADEFIDRNPAILDSKIMMTHYSRERLFSDEARGTFVPPDLDPIPGVQSSG